MDEVRIGLIGCGGFQRYRVTNLLKVKEARIVALADTSDEQIALMRNAHPVTADVPAYHDYREMIEKSNLDAVLIATPHTQHVEQILYSLEHGLHTLCEKPMVTSTADALRVIAARDKAKKQAMVSYQRHFQPEFRYIRDRILSGEAGEVTYIAALQCQGWKKGTVGTWRQDPALSGGGQLNDSGSHLVDIMLWTTGLKADSVSANIDFRGTEVDIDSALSIRFRNGALGTISIIGDAPKWHEDITIWCQRMMFAIRQDQGLTVTHADGSRFKAEHLSGSGSADQNFIEAILGKCSVESPCECGLEVIRLTEAAWKSAQSDGESVKIDSLT
ncbi:MAG TPA: Gfo/Idh/MocA family oxidoreductase [Fimbriimonadaceae bacterium]|nr:Gfo/Idh/MocA family oxidoreductase [Fimbriimonadaceae bacterium]